MLKLVLPLQHISQQRLHAVVDAVPVTPNGFRQLLRNLEHHIGRPLRCSKLVLYYSEKGIVRVEATWMGGEAASVDVDYVLVLAEEETQLVA